jgi:O-antigen/teichoic acid export membrane protein
MKVFTRLSAHPGYTRIFHWGKLLTITGSAQILIQAIGFASGILIIRLLPTHEYALYTLANTMLGTMTILADGGIASGVMAQGGKVWKDKQQLGVVLATGMSLRKKFAIGSLLIAIPALFFLLRLHHASLLVTVLIIASLVPAFWAALSDSLLEIAPKLNQNIIVLQRNQVAVSIGRLIIITGTLFIFPWTFIAILGNGLPRIWGNLKLRAITSNYADFDQKPDKLVADQILVIVKRTLPGAIYYCLSGQITVWLISIFGSTESIAQVGALSRLAMLLTLVSVVLGTLFEPRFARLPNNKRIIISRLFQIQGALFLLSFLIVFFVWLFPHQVLSILGKGYAGLTTEVLLLAAGSCLGMISGSIYKLSSARGIVPRPAVFIPVIIMIQVVFAVVVDFSKVRGALEFSIFTFFSAWVYRLIYFLRWVNKNVSA